MMRTAPLDPLKDLVHRIAERHFPDEVLPYELEADEALAELDKKGAVAGPAGGRTAFEFSIMGALSGGLLIFQVLEATYKIYQFFKGKPLPADIGKTWLEALTKHGLSEDKAREVVNDFIEQLAKIGAGKK